MPEKNTWIRYISCYLEQIIDIARLVYNTREQKLYIMILAYNLGKGLSKKRN